MHILSEFDDRFRIQQIAVELDLEGGDIQFPSELVRSAICALIENAIQAMPQGGELSVTLVETGHQCEIEIADSGSRRGKEADIAEPPKPVDDIERQTIRLLPYLRRKNLETARQQAMRLGGALETWDCPQGGTAHVLVFPIRSNKKQNRVTRNHDG